MLPLRKRRPVRPEDVILERRGTSAAPVPIDVALEALDTELETTGARARRMVNGHRQPTRYFSLELRRELVDALGPEDDPISRR
jgi:hypothetical protein